MGRLIRERFRGRPDPFVERFVSSAKDDERLLPHEIQGSIAHARTLQAAGLLSRKEASAIVRALRRIRREFEAGEWSLSVEDEDVHMNVERRLGKLAGRAGRKIHAGRSRNDQVALDLRLWVRQEIDGLRKEIGRLRKALVRKAARHAETILPGYTHLQRAQPVLFAHVLLSYEAMLHRDDDRLQEVRRRVNVSPLGAGALAGTSLPIDPRLAARALGFDDVFANSLDAVRDRDFAVETVFVCSLLQTHLSQIAEDLILWSSREFAFIDLPDALCTSSSIMPQKRNADLVELVRAKTGRVVGDLVSLLTILKALPGGYNRDLQESKPPLYDALETARLSVQAIALAIKGMAVHKDTMMFAAQGDEMLATDIAEYLVEKGLPFREAHGIVARLMRTRAEGGPSVWDLTLTDLKKLSPAFDSDVFRRLSPRESVRRRRSRGGTGFAQVKSAIRKLAR